MAKTHLALVATLLFTSSGYGAFLDGENQNMDNSGTAPSSNVENPNVGGFPEMPQFPSNSGEQAPQLPETVVFKPGMPEEGEEDGEEEEGPTFSGGFPPMHQDPFPFQSTPSNGDEFEEQPSGMIELIIGDMPMGVTDPDDVGENDEETRPMRPVPIFSDPEEGNFPAAGAGGVPSNLDEMFQIINEALNAMLEISGGAKPINSNGPDGWPSGSSSSSNPYKYPGLGGYLKGESRELAKNCTRAMDTACNCTSTAGAISGMRCAKECWFDETKIDVAVAEGCPVLSCHRATLKHCDTCFNASTFRVNATCVAECDLAKTQELIDGGCTKLQCRVATNQTCTPTCNDECADLCADSTATTAISEPTPIPDTMVAASTEPAMRHMGGNYPPMGMPGMGHHRPSANEQAQWIKAYKCEMCTDRCFKSCRRENTEALNKQGCNLKVTVRPSTTVDTPLKPTATVFETVTESLVETAAAAPAGPAFPTVIETPSATA